MTETIKERMKRLEQIEDVRKDIQKLRKDLDKLVAESRREGAEAVTKAILKRIDSEVTKRAEHNRKQNRGVDPERADHYILKGAKLSESAATKALAEYNKEQSIKDQGENDG